MKKKKQLTQEHRDKISQGLKNSKKRFRYPFDKWFSRKKPVVIRWGWDYYCMTHSMITQLRKHAQERGVKVSLKVVKEALFNTEGIQITVIKP